MSSLVLRPTSYELVIVIREGTLNYQGFHASLYVETSIDSKINVGDRTEVMKMHGGKVFWDKKVVKYFSDLEPATPILISMSMYKKRLFQQGYKLIGTVHFSTSDLIPILNKGMTHGRANLSMRRNQFATTGSLLLGLQLQTINFHQNRAPLQRPISAPVTCSKPLDLVSSFHHAHVQTVSETNINRSTSGSMRAKLFWLLLLVVMMVFCTFINVIFYSEDKGKHTKET